LDNLLTAGPSDSGGEEEDGPSSDASLQSVIVFEGPKDLAHLAEAINHYHQTAQEHLRKGGAYALTTGELLEAAKEQVKHGEWLRWRERNCLFSERTAQGYMRFARYCRAHPDKAAALLSMTFSKALRSLPLPKSATAADLEDKEVAEAMDNTPTPGLAARMASDKDKVGNACNYLWHLGMALKRAPSPSMWGELTEPLDREHLQRFALEIIAELMAVVQELRLKGGGGE